MAGIRQELQKGWLILLISICTFVTAFIPALSLPFIFKPVIDEFGWSREQATLLSTVFFAPGAVVSIVIGRVIDISGVKRALIGAVVCGGLGLLCFLWTSGLLSYYLPGALMGVGMAGTMVAIKLLIAQKFEAAQGTAMGITYMVAGLATIAIPVLVSVLIEAAGWRVALAYMSLGVWCISLPLIIICINEPYSGKQPKLSANKLAEKKSETKAAFISLAGERRFWLILIAITIAAMVDQGLTQHANLYLELDLGFDTSTIAKAVSVMFAAGAVGRLLLGWTYDKLSVRGISLTYILLALTCLLALPINGIVLLMSFMILRGVTHAGVLLDSPVLGKHCYGQENLGLVIGLFTAVISVGFALGPWFMGRMFEVFHSYTPAFILFAILSIISAVLLYWVEPSHWLAQGNKNI